MASGGCLFCIFFAFASIITGGVILIVSFADGRVNENEIAFKYDSNALRLYETDPYTSAGLNMVGPGYRLVKFTTLEQSAEFGSLGGRTVDGMKIVVGFQFQYKFDTSPESLIQLYYYFGTRKANGGIDNPRRKKAIYEVAYVAALDALATYTAYDAKQKQEELAASLMSKIHNKLHGMFGITVTNLQLEGVELPDSVADAISKTLAVEQNVKTAENTQATVMVSSETAIQNAGLEAEVTIYTAEEQANALLTAAEASADAILTTMKAEAAAYKVLYDKVNTYYSARQDPFSKDDFINYVWMQSLQGSTSAKKIFDVDLPKRFDS